MKMNILGSELQKKEFEKLNKNSSFYFDLIKNKNFLNNQNYVKSKKNLKIIKKSINIESGNEGNMKNIVGFNPLKIFQEININKLNYEFNKTNIFVIGIILMIFIPFCLIYFKDDNFNKEFGIFGFLGVVTFLSFILYFFLFFTPKQRNYKFYFNKDKILIFNTLILKQTQKLPKITRI